MGDRGLAQRADELQTGGIARFDSAEIGRQIRAPVESTGKPAMNFRGILDGDFASQPDPVLLQAICLRYRFHSITIGRMPEKLEGEGRAGIFSGWFSKADGLPGSIRGRAFHVIDHQYLHLAPGGFEAQAQLLQRRENRFIFQWRGGRINRGRWPQGR